MSLFRRWFGYDPEDFCKEGLSALDRRDFEAAAKAFQTCAESSDREATIRLARFHLAECHAQIAEAHYRSGDYDKARDEIDVSLAYAKPTAERHLLAAQIARRLNDRQSAAYQLDCVLAQRPTHEEALALRALEWYEEGHVDEALAAAGALPRHDSRLIRFHEAHERGDRTAATAHLSAVATGYATTLV